MAYWRGQVSELIDGCRQAGATRCIGEEFGLAEATLILASMAARWNLAPEAGTTVSPAARAVLVPNGRGARPHDQLPHRGGYAGLVHNRVMPAGATAGSPPAAGDGAAG